MGGSAGGNKSSSTGSTNQDVWSGQSGALGDLYNNANQLYNSQGVIDPSNATQLSQDAAESASGGFNNQITGGSYGDTSDIRDKLMNSMGGQSQMGQMYNSIVGGEGNTYIDPMVDAMKSGAMENNSLLQSGNNLDAAAMGQGGSSRHAMQNAMTNRATNQDMLDQEIAMRGGAYDTDLNMKMGIASMADQNSQLEQDRMLSMLQGADANTQFGVGNVANMQNASLGTMAPGMQSQNQSWSNMGNYANTIGGPTVLNSGSQSGSSKGAGGGGGLKG